MPDLGGKKLKNDQKIPPDLVPLKTCIQTSKFLFFLKRVYFPYKYMVDPPSGKPSEFFRFKQKKG